MQKVPLPSSSHHGKLLNMLMLQSPQQPLHQLQSKVKQPIAVANQLVYITLCFVFCSRSEQPVDEANYATEHLTVQAYVAAFV